MSNDVLDNQPVNGSIIVTSRNNGGTQFSDRSSDGGFVTENPLVAETQRSRAHLGQRIRGAAEPSGLPCSCANGGTYRRGVPAEAPCIVCGGDRK
jgi:hypothetical protein